MATRFLTLLLFALLLAGCSTPESPTELVYGGSDPVDIPDPGPIGPATGTNIGNQAPDFTLDDSYGNTWTLSAQQGKPVLLYFWASTCGYCAEQNPRIQGWYETYADSLTVISINLGESETLINAYLASYDLDFPALLCTNGVQTAYGVYTIPHALLLDAEGIVRFNDHPGYLTDDDLTALF